MRVDLATARLIAAMFFADRDVTGVPAEQRTPMPWSQEDLADVSWATVLAGCIRNKVPLLSLPIPALAPERGRLVARFLNSEVCRAALDEERADWASTREQYREVQSEFDRAGIRAVLIKSAGIAPSLPYRSDNLDVLIDPQHDRLAREILLRLRYVELTNIEEPDKFLFRKFHLGRSISAIHLHEAVGWGTGFMDDAQVLARARPAPDDPEVLIPAAEDSLLINMAHAFYEDKEVKLGDLFKIIHLLRRSALDWDIIAAQAHGRGWRDGLSACVLLWSSLEALLYGAQSFAPDLIRRAEEWAPDYGRRYLESRRHEIDPRFPYSISFRLSKRFYYAKVMRDPALRARQKAIDVARHSLAGLKRRLPFKTQPGMLITLSGIDGSGKTVHAERLCDALTQSEVDARVVWLRGGSSPLAKRVIRVFKPWASRGRLAPRSGADPAEPVDLDSDTRRAKVARKSSWLRHPLLRWGWTQLVLGDLLATCWVRIGWPLARGRVVICDRYVYDALVELAALQGQASFLSSGTAWIAKKLFPQPQRAYWLRVPPREAAIRKPEELLSFLETQHSLYDRIAATWPLRVLDTASEPGESMDILVHDVLREYYRHWHTLIAGLFWCNPEHHPISEGI